MTDSEKLDRVLKWLEDVSNQVITLDQNVGVLKADVDANLEKDREFRREVRQSLERLETAVVVVSEDNQGLHERLHEVDQHARQFELIKGSNGHG